MIINLGNHGYETNELPDYSYTGKSKFLDDGNGNWRLMFLTSGTLTINRANSARKVDAFCVGGGGGATGGRQRTAPDSGAGGGGGGGGKCTTAKISLRSRKKYDILIGEGGAGTRGFYQEAKPGGPSAIKEKDKNLAYAAGGAAAWQEAAGGNGGNGGTGQGGNGSSGSAGTPEFGTPGETVYGGGGGGGSTEQSSYAGSGGSGGGGNGGRDNVGMNGTANLGGGGGGGGARWQEDYRGGNGGSGIVIIRNLR